MIILSEKKNISYKKHSVQINLQDQISEKDYFFGRLQDLIPDEAIYREYPQRRRTSGNIWELTPDMLFDDPKEEYGRENEPHITCLYGLTDESDMFKIKRYLTAVDPFEIELDDISLFSSDPKYDVVKVEILSPELHEVNAWIVENCKNSQKFPEYHPHMTIAYVRKDAYTPDRNPCKGKRIGVRSMVFSSAGNEGTSEMPLKSR